VPVEGVPELHEAQRPHVVVAPPQVKVEVDAADERRLRFEFDIYQAVRVRTIDLFVAPPDVFRPRSVVEIEDSPWIAELRADLAQRDVTADFLDRSHHWLLHAGDGIVEVVAWEMTWQPA
jgi:hypothetical protein